MPNRVQAFASGEGPIKSGAELAGNLLYNAGSTHLISEWENQIVGARVESSVAPEHQARIRNPLAQTDFVNEGSGSGQLLFILERLANAPDGTTIGIEEPEIHLHPRAQFKLGQLMGDLLGSLERQLIITTHSPSLIAGVLASVRARKISAKDVGIVFFAKDGASTRVEESLVSASGT